MELNTHTALQNDFKRQIDGRLSKLVWFKSMWNIQSVCVKIGQIKNNLFPAFAKKSMIIFEAVNMQINVLYGRITIPCQNDNWKTKQSLAKA